jgi:hypothetical protein
MSHAAQLVGRTLSPSRTPQYIILVREYEKSALTDFTRCATKAHIIGAQNLARDLLTGGDS